MSEYWRLKREAREADGYWQRTLGLQSPWQNDYQPLWDWQSDVPPIRAINPPPPYHWLGRDAETVA